MDTVPDAALRPGSETPEWPTETEVLANAKVAYAEVRSQIDLQVRCADAIDTKATALITAVGVVAALVAPRLQLGSLLPQVAAASGFILALATVTCCLFAIKPRKDFAYGADPTDLIKDRQPERFPEASYLLAVVKALVEARDKNATRIDQKAGWFVFSIATLLVLLVAIGWLVSIGGIK